MKRILCLFFLLFLNIMAKSFEEAMNIYSFYTDSHTVLKDEWFLPSLMAIKDIDNFNLIIRYYDQECERGSFNSKGWNKTMIRKVEMILDAIEENWGKIFIYADIDIQFFQPMRLLIEKEIQNYDIVLQKDSPELEICAGFFACRANENTKKLWSTIYRIMVEDPSRDDQKPLNKILRNNEMDIKWNYLPIEFMSGGTLIGRYGYLWKPGIYLPIPSNIVLHHANWTIGVQNKIAQLEYVKSLKNKRYIRGRL
jgi:hypothetical protein